MRVITNHHWRPFVCGCDVPDDIITDQFAHLDDDERIDGFIHYRNRWYHTSDFLTTSEGSWHGQHTDTLFSAVLIELSDDGERYRIGLALA